MANGSFRWCDVAHSPKHMPLRYWAIFGTVVHGRIRKQLERVYLTGNGSQKSTRGHKCTQSMPNQSDTVGKADPITIVMSCWPIHCTHTHTETSCFQFALDCSQHFCCVFQFPVSLLEFPVPGDEVLAKHNAAFKSQQAKTNTHNAYELITN